ncbi:MAG: hypothetical protein ACNS61_11965 [Candidatus Wenzhouxiangella sp. M2_3B_020]
MKKLLLIAAFGLLASPALAQNTATSSSSGNGNDVDIEQSLVESGENTATVEQVGSGMSATIEQVYSATSTSSIGEFNRADLLQTGTDHAASVYQLGGRGNSAKLTQEGTGTANTATIAQRAGETVEGYAGAERALQSGAGNDLQVYQSINPATITPTTTNSFSTAGITQVGDDNTIYVEQDGGNNFEAQVKQDGDENDANVFQTGQGQSADVSQVGDLNIADVDQGFGFQDAAPNSTVDIDQSGTSHQAYVIQGGGDMNSVTVSQSISGGYADVYQNGASNTTTITQN